MTYFANSLDEAILRTVLYADVFDTALTPAEIQLMLIGRAATPAEVLNAIEASTWLAERLARAPNGCVTLRDRTPLAALRAERQHLAAQLWPAARRWAQRIGGLPFVRMVAVTGALAMDNALAGDDIDFLIVTEPGRVWLARALAIGLVYVARRRGVGLCPNYVLARTVLAQTRRDAFIAHDLAQMVPLVGHAMYTEMRAANRWAEAYLPNAAHPLRREAELQPRGWQRALQRLGEWLLSGAVGNALETWERERKLQKFRAAARVPGSAAQLDANRVKGHFNDHGHVILQKYQSRVARYF
jgi:hypothetical protein